MAEFNAATSPEELAFIRAQYAGKLTMVDRWFGELLRTLDELALWDDTVVIVTTDHGHDLGQRGTFGKQYPHYDSHANIPLFVWHPDFPGNGQALSTLTSTVDLFATLLETGGALLPERTHSRSILPIIRGEADTHRSALVYGTFGQGVCCTDGEWTIFKSPVQDQPLFFYSTQIYRSLVAEEGPQAPVEAGYFIPGVNLSQWRVPTRYRRLDHENHLFHRAEDPNQERNVWDAADTQRQRMIELLGELLTEEGLPSEQLDRLGLNVR